MIIDGHVHIGDTDPIWRSGPFTASDLLTLMDEPMTLFGEQRRIDLAAAMPRSGSTTLDGKSFDDQHADVSAALEAHPDRFIGTFVLNPRLGLEDGITALQTLRSQVPYRIVKMHPTLHNYWPQSKDLAYPILEEAARLAMPVLIHSGEPPYSVPAHLDVVARDHPDTTIIIAHFGTHSMSYASDAISVARHNPNIYLETSGASLPQLVEGVKAVGHERMIFGSNAPMHEPHVQLRTVECLARKPPLGVGLSEDRVLRILGGNLMELAGPAPDRSGGS